MKRTFFFRMIITMVITMGFANVTMANEPTTFSIDGTDYFVWSIDCQGTLHVTPLEGTTTNFDKSPFIKYRKQIKNAIIEDDFYSEESFKTIGTNFFKGLDCLEKVQVAESVRIIGEGAFEGCSALKEITMPVNVESIGRNALRGCTSLVMISTPDSPDWEKEAVRHDVSAVGL